MLFIWQVNKLLRLDLKVGRSTSDSYLGEKLHINTGYLPDNISNTLALKNKKFLNAKNTLIFLGGKAILWKKKASLNLDVFESTNPEYIVIQDCDKEFQSQAEAFEDYNNIMKHLSTISKRSIPLQEIALAILHCSCEKNCNPNFDRMKALIHSEKSAFTESQILALNTESVSQVFIANTQNSVSETPLDKINISPIKNTQQTDSIDIMNVEEVSETQRSATLSHLEDSGPKKTKENETDSMRTISDIPSCSSSNKRAIDQVDAALEPRKCEKVKKIKVDETKNVNPFTFK